MSSSSADAAALDRLAGEALAIADAALANGSTAAISDAAVAQLITAGARLFAAKVEHERRYFAPLTGPDALTATEAATVVTEILRAVDLNLFDLSMWASRPRD